MFERILIANRGEIACRVARTARRLGLHVAAVYSDADRDALHVREADEAHRIGPAPARESYLDAGAILAAARASGAQAVHPGYGFLSENADFAEACAAAGLAFVGPPAAAIRAMGEKGAAKERMAAAGVPVVPGHHGDASDDAVLAAAADALGFPVLIKAVAGGGGRGMRRVDRAGDFARALASARREAERAFGDARVLVERLIPQPRHIEIQVFADAHGNALHLFERDCSLQRRHQKVVEEAPAPGMSAALREAMGRAAVQAALAIDYRGAGTVEFIVDAGKGLEDAPFYFMEMNTRLQVEHPVTELVTGQDLVEWQLRVAAGEPLPLRQTEVPRRGCAVEVRLYAEDPERGFLPSSGELLCFRPAAGEEGVRVDAGVREGDRVGVHYDPLLAKLIGAGETRERALARLERALRGLRVAGVVTNQAFLLAALRHPAFRAGEIDTGFLERYRTELLPERGPAPDAILALAALEILLARGESPPADPADPHSPWDAADGWRPNLVEPERLRLRDGERVVEIALEPRVGGTWLELPGGGVLADARREGDEVAAEIGGRRLRARVLRRDGELQVLCEGERFALELFDPVQAAAGEEGAGDAVPAPMPGRVREVLVAAGDRVRRGQVVLVLEAMKMEHGLVAPRDGRVERVHPAVGDQVEEGQVLVELAEAD